MRATRWPYRERNLIMTEQVSPKEWVANMLSSMEPKLVASEAIKTGLLTKFIGTRQRRAMQMILQGEEADWMATLILDLKKRIDAMPVTYETQEQGDAAVVHLHYFLGSADAWITEKDVGDPANNDFRQAQAFGKVCFSGELSEAEAGYVSIEELLANGFELDLHWTQKSLKEIFGSNDDSTLDLPETDNQDKPPVL